MLSEKTVSQIRGLGLDANGFLTACKIVQEAIDDAMPAKQTTALALTLPGDWPADYQAKFWKPYPKKDGKKDAMKLLDKVAYAGKTKWVDLMSGLERYIISEKVKRGFCMDPARFLRGEHWKDEAQPEPHGGRRVQGQSAYEIAADLLSR